MVLKRVFEECGGDLDSAIRSLNELRLGSTDRNAVAALDDKAGVAPIVVNGDVPAKEQTTLEVLSMDGSDCVELFVREMLNASNINDARARASRALEVLKKSIRVRAGTEVAQNFHQVNNYALTMHLKQAQQRSSIPDRFNPDVFY
ncbi:Ubiquitin system component Cue protein, putative isoform 2 [Hibiscus syriacus]|uniref:Ubiquitin system component Cue protein, putative isoform 2 n=1 Tax=Hibiscus syriacus TaxID=106335 RepID=A0A6A3BDL4_HIBSY|nr:Ubiquitin system component Cue protein, putative isoform 2 [Hibiscus syriacus]